MGCGIDYLKQEILELIKESGTKNPLVYARETVKDYSEEILNNTIASCNLCGFNSYKILGSGNIHGTVLVIGDYPDSSLLAKKQNIKILDNNNNIQYTLEGSFLNTIANNLFLDINEFYYMNTVCCCCLDINTRQPRPPRSQEIKNCSVYVKYIVELMHPSLIILLGNVALNIFKKESMTKAHGQWVNAYTIPAMPVYSPFYIQSLIGKVTEERRQQLIQEMWNDIKYAFVYLKNQYPKAKIFLNAESEEI